LAGRWYPADRKDIEAACPPARPDEAVVAALVPHAGWTYSGGVAGAVFARLPRAGRFVLIGVNHGGIGHPRSLFPYGAWNTPLGPLTVDADFAARWTTECPGLSSDETAHGPEHSLEVQAPFIAHYAPNAKIVPLLLFDYSPLTCRAVGEALARAIQADKIPTVIVASSDLSHVGGEYDVLPPKSVTSDAFARSQDELALEPVLALDADGLLRAVRAHGISMCGSGPVAVALHAAKALGARRAERVAYATSADVSGDDTVAVGYAGVLFLR
jgi:hypothetical protein